MKLNKILCFAFAVITMFLAIFLKDIKLLVFLIYLGILFILKLNSSLKFILITFGFLGYFLGFQVHLYKITNWYDIFVHFISGIYISLISIYILDKFKMFNKKNIIFNIVFITLFVLSISVLWEVIEYFVDNIFNSDMQRKATGVNDTMKDIICAFLGSLLFNVSFYYEYKNNKKLLIQNFINNMIGGSYGTENIRFIKK